MGLEPYCIHTYHPADALSPTLKLPFLFILSARAFHTFLDITTKSYEEKIPENNSEQAFSKTCCRFFAKSVLKITNLDTGQSRPSDSALLFAAAELFFFLLAKAVDLISALLSTVRSLILRCALQLHGTSSCFV
jgi:hypothetical protein